MCFLYFKAIKNTLPLKNVLLVIVDARLVVKKYAVRSVNNIEKGMCQKHVQNEKHKLHGTFAPPLYRFLCFAYIRH
jgi:hypothetical protein